MTDLRPCKLCNGKAIQGDFTGAGDTSFYTACDDDNDTACRLAELFGIQFPTQAEADAFWNALNDPTPSIKAGARAAIEAATKLADECLKPVVFPMGAQAVLMQTCEPLPDRIRSLDIDTIVEEVKHD